MIRCDQVYHHYLGDPLEVLLLRPDGSGEIAVVGPDLAAGMRPQLLVPAGTYHVSRVAGGGRFALLGTTEWPGVEAPDVQVGDVEALMAAYPALRDEIASFTHTRPKGASPAVPYGASL
jgi:predicted cupin superfamily sugar epimerase